MSILKNKSFFAGKDFYSVLPTTVGLCGLTVAEALEILTPEAFDEVTDVINSVLNDYDNISFPVSSDPEHLVEILSNNCKGYFIADCISSRAEIFYFCEMIKLSDPDLDFSELRRRYIDKVSSVPSFDREASKVCNGYLEKFVINHDGGDIPAFTELVELKKNVSRQDYNSSKNVYYAYEFFQNPLRVVFQKLIFEYEITRKKSAWVVDPVLVVPFLNEDRLDCYLSDLALSKAVRVNIAGVESNTACTRNEAVWRAGKVHCCIQSNKAPHLQKNIVDGVVYCLGLIRGEGSGDCFYDYKTVSGRNEIDRLFSDLFDDVWVRSNYEVMKCRFNLHLMPIIENIKDNQSLGGSNGFEERCLNYALSYLVELIYWARNYPLARLRDNAKGFSSIFDWSQQCLSFGYNPLVRKEKKPLGEVLKVATAYHYSNLSENVYTGLERCYDDDGGLKERSAGREPSRRRSTTNKISINNLIALGEKGKSNRKRADKIYAEELRYIKAFKKDFTKITQEHDNNAGKIIDIALNFEKDSTLNLRAIIGGEGKQLPCVENLILHSARHETLYENTAAIKKYPIADILTEFLTYCKAVEKMHSNNFAHLDLKPQNLLHTGKSHEKIIIDFQTVIPLRQEHDSEVQDFWNATAGNIGYKSEESIVEHVYTRGYVCPARKQIFDENKGHEDSRSVTLQFFDLYSMVCVLKFMLTDYCHDIKDPKIDDLRFVTVNFDYNSEGMSEALRGRLNEFLKTFFVYYNLLATPLAIEWSEVIKYDWLSEKIKKIDESPQTMDSLLSLFEALKEWVENYDYEVVCEEQKTRRRHNNAFKWCVVAVIAACCVSGYGLKWYYFDRSRGEYQGFKERLGNTKFSSTPERLEALSLANVELMNILRIDKTIEFGWRDFILKLPKKYLDISLTPEQFKQLELQKEFISGCYDFLVLYNEGFAECKPMEVLQKYKTGETLTLAEYSRLQRVSNNIKRIKDKHNSLIKISVNSDKDLEKFNTDIYVELVRERLENLELDFLLTKIYAINELERRLLVLLEKGKFTEIERITSGLLSDDDFKTSGFPDEAYYSIYFINEVAKGVVENRQGELGGAVKYSDRAKDYLQGSSESFRSRVGDISSFMHDM